MRVAQLPVALVVPLLYAMRVLDPPAVVRVTAKAEVVQEVNVPDLKLLIAESQRRHG